MKKITLLLASFFLIGSFTYANENILAKGDYYQGLTKRYRYTKPIKFVERGVEFFVFPNGEFNFNTNRRSYRGSRERINTSYYGPGHLNYSFPSKRYRGSRIYYDRLGRVKSIGNTYIRYDRLGRIVKAGNVYIDYNRRGLVSNIGGLYIRYNRWGKIAYLDGYVNDYDYRNTYDYGYVHKNRRHHKNRYYDGHGKYKERGAHAYKKKYDDDDYGDDEYDD